MAERLEVATAAGAEGKSDLYLELEGDKAGQFFIVPDDDFYTCHTSMTREQALALAAELVRLWTPDWRNELERRARARVARESGYPKGSNPPPPSDDKPDVE
jgi:hypothetical protein